MFHALCLYFIYTTNPTERSAAATERSAAATATSKSDLESSVESHRALAEQWLNKSVERLVGLMV